ncbi:MAG: hypothetical protein ABFD25_18755 [Clostridiaceae bacterium]
MTDLKLTRDGSNVKYERVEISIELNPEQRRLLSRIAGKNIEKLELTASELKRILTPQYMIYPY